MSPKELLSKINNVKQSVIPKLVKYVLFSDNDFILNYFLKLVYRNIYENEMKLSGSEYVAKIKFAFFKALIKQGRKNIKKNILSKQWVKNVSNAFCGIFYSKQSQLAKENYRQKYEIDPPAFCTISPTQKCNLNCVGCYAASCVSTSSSLPYWVVERIIKEMYTLCGSRFIVISGGEPFLWKDEDKDIISLAEQFKDVVFLVYTNGTALNEDSIKRLKEVAVTPAISVEGFEKETDERRGKGIFKKVLNTIELLKKYGIAFGISVTATKNNLKLLLDDKFYEYWFDDVGATYMWMFHLMPIGRAKDTMELMLSAEERISLLYKWEKLIFEKEYFIGDFWNAGFASDGCIAYARPGGYFYVDWNGDIMPCVFIPYYKDNIYDLYKNGKTIIDAFFSDYFIKGRNWQKEYGYTRKPVGNFFAPCSIRDNHKYFRENILSEEIKPEDENAKDALEDPEYYKKMLEFDNKLHELTERFYQEKVLKNY